MDSSEESRKAYKTFTWSIHHEALRLPCYLTNVHAPFPTIYLGPNTFINVIFCLSLPILNSSHNWFAVSVEVIDIFSLKVGSYPTLPTLYPLEHD